MSILSLLKNLKNISNIRINIEYKDTEKPTDHLVSKRIPFSEPESMPKLAQAFDEQGKCLHINHKIATYSSETRYFKDHQYVHDTITYCCEDCGMTKLSYSDVVPKTGISHSSFSFELEDDRSASGEL